MQWIRDNCISLFMAAVVVLGTAAGYGAVKYQCRQHGVQLERKADKDAVYRELDQIRAQLTRMETKLDGLIGSQPQSH